MQAETRRSFLRSAGAFALALGDPSLLRAATDLLIADAHSHLGMFSSKLVGQSLKAEMQASGVMLLAWSIVGDARWTMTTNYGIQQKSVPAGGEQAAFFRQKLDTMREYGPEHVMFGTDLDGMGRFGTMEGLGDLRRVADLLRERGVDDKTLRAVCFDNYARCLRAVMQARQA